LKETTAGNAHPRQKASEITLSKTEAEDVFQQVTDMLSHIVSVPKSEVDKRQAAYKKNRAKKKR
jgi:hypothetical protein